MLELALEQNPRDPLVMEVLDRVSAGKRVSPSAVNARIARSALSVAERAAGLGDKVRNSGRVPAGELHRVVVLKMEDF